MKTNFAAAKGPIIAATTAISAAVLQFGRLGDEVQKMSLRTGFSTESLSELRFAMEQAGTSIQGFEVGVRRMSGFIEDAKDGLSTSTIALDKLGVSVDDLVGKSPEDTFFTLANAMAGVEDATQKAALAQDIFGRSGTQLLPLLAEGADGIEALRQEARDLGIVMDQETANKAAKMQDAINSAKQSMNGLAITVGTTLAPAITLIAKGFSVLPAQFRAAAVAAGVFFTAMRLGLLTLRQAMISTGIGALVIGVGLLADKLGLLGSAAGDAGLSVEELDKKAENTALLMEALAASANDTGEAFRDVSVDATLWADVLKRLADNDAKRAAEALQDLRVAGDELSEEGIISKGALQGLKDLREFGSIEIAQRVRAGNQIIRTSTEDTVVNLTSKWRAFHEFRRRQEEDARRAAAHDQKLGQRRLDAHLANLEAEKQAIRELADLRIAEEQRVQGLINTLRGRFKLDQQESLGTALRGSLNASEALSNLRALLELRARTALSFGGDPRALAGGVNVGAAGSLLGIGDNTFGSGLDIVSQLGAIPSSFEAVIRALARATGQQVEITLSPDATDMIVARVVNGQLNGAEV